jgi:hypothetical protein
MGDYRPAGSKVWSPEEWEEYSRLKTEEAEADDEAAEAIQLHGKLQDRMGVQLGPEKKWDHTTWPTAEKSEYKRLLGEFGKFSKIAREASNRRSALVARLKQKYPAASLARKQAIAVEATKSPVFEKLKYAPPRMGLPGGPGYELAKASFGKGRTRRHKRHRHRRRHRKTLRRK